MNQLKAAAIIGNGPSREPIDLFTLALNATTFGCNALYRDFGVLDYLVAIDEGMIKEIESHRSLLPNTTIIFPPEDERWESAEYSVPRRRSNAGMNAMSEAIKLGHNVLYCLGFDFILEGKESVGNVYKGTKNYGPETAAQEADSYWRIRYFEWFARQHPDVTIIMVIPDDGKNHQIQADNVKGMRLSKFNSKLDKG